MKKYIFALALVLSIGAHAFEVSGNHFEGKFKIDSMTVGENEVTVNASSAAACTIMRPPPSRSRRRDLRSDARGASAPAAHAVGAAQQRR